MAALLLLAFVASISLAGKGGNGKGGGKKPPPPAAEPDPAICYRPSGGSSLWAMNDDGSNQYQVSGLRHFGSSWSPDGAHIAVPESTGPNPLYRVDVDGSNQQVLVSSGVFDAAWSPLGDRIAYTGNEARTLEVIPAEGGTPTTLHSVVGPSD